MVAFGAGAFLLTLRVLLSASLSSAVPLAQAPAAPAPPAGGSGYWLGSIKHQGQAAFNPNPASYQVFRNVKELGAKGDGVTDDTDVINKIIADGNRCGEGCDSSTTTPALVYFPPGTYMISKPIIQYYYTMFVGDPLNMPVLKATANFEGMGLIDADPYIPGGNGANWFATLSSTSPPPRLLLVSTGKSPKPPVYKTLFSRWPRVTPARTRRASSRTTALVVS